jgi:chromosome segregation ATPase
MTNIVQSLRLNLPLPSFDTVVHLGAGPYFTSDLYEQLSARQYVLVDADPQACENLRNSAPSDRYAVHTRFLCPESGKRSFHRYNLATLNSPLRPGPLAEIYPRLRDTETLEWNGTAIADFLKEIPTSDLTANCLILDLPGQESELVASVTEEILHRFEWILVRGAGQLRMENAKPIEETTTLLTHVGFSCCDADPVHDSIYPLAAFHLDKRALQIRRLQDARMTLEAQVGKLEAAKQEAAKAFDARLAELSSQLDTLTSEKTALNTQLASLTSERDQFKKSAGDHHNALAAAKQELEALKAQAAEAEKKRTELSDQLDARTKERDALASERDQFKQSTADHTNALAAAKQELDTLKAQAADTEKKRAELATQLDARTKESDTLASEKNAVHTQLATLASERDALWAERDQFKKSAGDHHNALAVAKQELEALKAQAADTEKKRSELAGQLDARTKERETLTSEKTALNAQLASLASERDQLKKTVADRASRIAELEAQVADQAERQIQIDEQMTRAEAQLEMLKDFMRPSFD